MRRESFFHRFFMPATVDACMCLMSAPPCRKQNGQTRSLPSHHPQERKESASEGDGGLRRYPPDSDFVLAQRLPGL